MNNLPETYRYLYKRDKPFMLKILGYIIAGVALFTILESLFIGMLLIIGSTGIFFYQTGIELNFQNNTFLEIVSMGPQSFGEWKPLPPIEYISVFGVNLVSTVYGRSGTGLTNKRGVFQVNLITNNNRRIRLLETENLDEAFKFANEYSSKLNLKVWDASTKDAKWLLSIY